jgi:hypothetical protein
MYTFPNLLASWNRKNCCTTLSEIVPPIIYLKYFTLSEKKAVFNGRNDRETG